MLIQLQYHFKRQTRSIRNQIFVTFYAYKNFVILLRVSISYTYSFMPQLNVSNILYSNLEKNIHGKLIFLILITTYLLTWPKNCKFCCIYSANSNFLVSSSHCPRYNVIKVCSKKSSKSTSLFKWNTVRVVVICMPVSGVALHSPFVEKYRLLFWISVFAEGAHQVIWFIIIVPF